MEYIIKLTQQELNIIYMALGEVPVKIGINLLAKLQKEQKEQDEKNAVPIDSLM